MKKSRKQRYGLVHLYLSRGYELFQLRSHDATDQKTGKPAGKLPLYKGYKTKEPFSDEHAVMAHFDKGFNVGVRLKPNQVVLDFDPRNYSTSQKVEEYIANCFGFLDFAMMVDESLSVKTPSGGYHIYCTVPEGFSYLDFKTVSDEVKGLDFKKHGSFVVAAGSMNQYKEYYELVGDCDELELSTRIIDIFKRDRNPEHGSTDPDDESYGLLTPDQLDTLVLSKLNIYDYPDNDSWFPIMAASHYITGGTGLSEFIDWSMSDSEYKLDQELIETRWKSLHTNSSNYKIGTLIKELKESGENVSDLTRLLDTRDLQKLTELADKTEELGLDVEGSESDELINDIIDKMDFNSEHEAEELERTEGDKKPEKALNYFQALPANPSKPEIKKMLRLYNNCPSAYDKALIEMGLKDKGIFNNAELKKFAKAVREDDEGDNIDTLHEILSKKVMFSFKYDKKNPSCKKYTILTEPNDQIFIFRKTHWIPISDRYLGKIVYKALEKMKQTTAVTTVESAMVSEVVRSLKIKTANIEQTFFNQADTEITIINCKNKEIHLNTVTGKATVKSHDPFSYQTQCLDVVLKKDAKSPLFDSTIDDIFNNCRDKDDMIRHLWEVLGYIIQGNKNYASWFLFRGPGGDGKSLILKVLSSILGSNYFPANESLVNGDKNNDNHGSIDLVNKRAIGIEELKEGVLLDDGALKMLSEETSMKGNPKGKDAFVFKYTASLVVCCNTYPQIRDTSRGTMRRINVIPFTREFDKEGIADRHRSKKIVTNQEEMAGILLQMLKGFKRFVKRDRFDTPKTCVEARENWLKQSNNIYSFFRDNIKTTYYTKVVGEFDAVYLLYEIWCDESGFKKVNKKTFKNSMINLGLNVFQQVRGKELLRGGKLIDSEEIEDFEEEMETFTFDD